MTTCTGTAKATPTGRPALGHWYLQHYLSRHDNVALKWFTKYNQDNVQVPVLVGFRVDKRNKLTWTFEPLWLATAPSRGHPHPTERLCYFLCVLCHVQIEGREFTVFEFILVYPGLPDSASVPNSSPDGDDYAQLEDRQFLVRKIES